MDRESVITHLQIIHTWAEFALEHDLQFFTPKHLEDIAQWSNDALNLLKEQETVVRCKDCRWRSNHGATSTKWLPCMDNRYDDDWFCADGERKEGR